MPENALIDQERIKPPETAAKKTGYLTLCVMVVCASMLSSITSLTVYDRFFATKIATYDLPGKLLLIEQAAKDGKISFHQAEQVSALETAEAKRLSDSMPSNYIVFSGDVVLGSHAKVIQQ